MELILTKTHAGLIPADQNTADYVQSLKLGAVVSGSFKKARNPRFHRKFFALLNLAFDLWESPQVECKYGVPEKNFDRFREDITILAGYYETVVRLNGSVRVEAKSISFASMDEEEFSALYNSAVNVILKHVMTKYTAEDVEEMVSRILNFG